MKLKYFALFGMDISDDDSLGFHTRLFKSELHITNSAVLRTSKSIPIRSDKLLNKKFCRLKNRPLGVAFNNYNG
jgi:hypothetical protein